MLSIKITYYLLSYSKLKVLMKPRQVAGDFNAIRRRNVFLCLILFLISPIMNHLGWSHGLPAMLCKTPSVVGW